MTGELRVGWRNLAAATLGLGFGIPSYTAVSSLFFQSVRTEFGWSSTAVAGAMVALPLTAAALPFAGRLIDRFGVRRISGISVFCLALSFLWLSRINGELRGYYAAFIALNVLGCATGPISYTRLVATQFRESRGTALAIAQFGIALIAAILPPLLAAIIISVGWRGAYLALAAAVLVGGTLAQGLMKPTPVDAVGFAAEPVGSTVSQAVRQPAFWLLAAAILCVSAGSLGLVTQFQPVLARRGVALSTAGWLLSLLAIAVMISRLAVGRLLDLKHPERCAALVVGVASLGALLLLIAGPDLRILVPAILLFGVSIGAELDLMGFFCARIFGLRHYSSIYGLIAISFYLGMALGGVGYGVIRDTSGSYDPALAASAASFAISALLFLALGPRRAGRLRGSARLISKRRKSSVEPGPAI